MTYIVRLNPRAFNPLTRKIDPATLWEVEQKAWNGGNGLQDSDAVIWHCAEVRVDGAPVRTLYTLPTEDQKPWQAEYVGICVRGQDNAVEIKTGAKR